VFFYKDAAIMSRAFVVYVRPLFGSA